MIPLICEMSSLKTLKIEIGYEVYADPLVEILSDCLTFVEYLSLDFHVDLSTFKNFTKDCKANLKKWVVDIDSHLARGLWKDYLMCVSNYQTVHNSLKVLGVSKGRFDWRNEDLKVIDTLRSQGVTVESDVLLC
jgi:hypothetical protein